MRAFAVVFAIVLPLAGTSGFIPGLSPSRSHPALVVTADPRISLGLFPVNALRDLVHLAFGVWRLLAARSVIASVVTPAASRSPTSCSRSWA